MGSTGRSTDTIHEVTRRPRTRADRGGLAHRGPGLVGSFALGSLVVFLAIGIGVALVMSGDVRQREEAAAMFHAEFLTTSVLGPALTPQDLAAPVTGPRYRELEAFVQDRILSDGRVVRVKVWGLDEIGRASCRERV